MPSGALTVPVELVSLKRARRPKFRPGWPCPWRKRTVRAQCPASGSAGLCKRLGEAQDAVVPGVNNIEISRRVHGEPGGAVSPVVRELRPAPSAKVVAKSGCPITISAFRPLAKLCALRNPRTRLFPVSATYKAAGFAVVSMAMPCGPKNSRPSTRLGAVLPICHGVLPDDTGSCGVQGDLRMGRAKHGGRRRCKGGGCLMTGRRATDRCVPLQDIHPAMSRACCGNHAGREHASSRGPATVVR